MKRNSMLFTIALIAVIAFAGSAQAMVTVTGPVNVTDADVRPEYVTVWCDNDPSDYATKFVQDMDPYVDYYWFDDLDPMLTRNGYIEDSSFDIPITVAMFCEGELRDINENPGGPYNNGYRNVTFVHTTIDFVHATYGVSLMELETCSDCSVEINKTVWDPVAGAWVDLAPNAVLNSDYRFRLEIHNDGSNCDLINIVVTDVLDSNFVYNDSAELEVVMGSGTWIPIDTPDLYVDLNNFGWTIDVWSGAPVVLAPCETIVIEFNATLIDGGVCCNNASVEAECECDPMQSATDWDTACTTTTYIAVDKTVWDGSAWALSTTGTIGETYRYRIEVENIGTLIPDHILCNLVVNDTLPAGLEYADSVVLTDHHGVEHLIDPPTDLNVSGGVTSIRWDINDFTNPDECLQPGQSFVIEYNVTVTNYGDLCNNAEAKGQTSTMAWSDGSDSACINVAEPDLIVSDIKVNYDASAMVNLAIGPRAPGTRTQCNNISINITELNVVDVEFGFDVTLEINGVAHACSPMHVPAVMAGGSTVTVYCDCFRPIADVMYNISATVDSGDAIIESDETNNVEWNNLTAITNGYKGNGWQDGRNVSALQCHEQGPINLVYSHGDSYRANGYYSFWGTYEVNWTSSDLNIPPTGTSIKKARLYAYYHADKTKTKWDNLSLTFNGYDMPEVAHYSDGKGFGGWDYTSDLGVLVYNVTHKIVVGGDNTAILTDNNIPGVGTGNNLTMEGMVLVVVYENPNEPDRIIWINEGCDLISSKYAKYGVSAEEATTYAAFEGCEPIPLDLVKEATLVSIAQIGNQGLDKNRLYFNDGEWNGMFPFGYIGSTNIGIHEADVKPYLKAEDNVATYQDNGDMFAAANSFLIVEKGGHKAISVDPEYTIVMPQDQFWVNITFDAHEYDIYALEYKLKYNTSVLYAEAQVEGDFLSSAGPTSVVRHVIDHTNGVLEFGVTLLGDNCKNGSSGTVARIHFHAIGSPGQVTDLDLYDVLVLNCSKVVNPSVNVDDGEVEIWKNKAPVSIGTTKHRYNNAAEKYTCYADLCACQSYDPDEGLTEIGDDLVYTMWHFGDGSSGTSEGAFDENCQKLHMYTSWNWTSTGEKKGYYTPFLAGLTLTDDGDPQLSDTDWFEVTIYMGGDANGDGVVNVIDAAYVGKHWREDALDDPLVECCPYWTVEQADKADLNNDREVNLLDMAIVGANWGHTAWA